MKIEKIFFIFCIDVDRLRARKIFFESIAGGSKPVKTGRFLKKRGGSGGGKNDVTKKHEKTTPWDFFWHFLQKTWTRYARGLSRIFDTFFLNLNSAIFAVFSPPHPDQKSPRTCYSTSIANFHVFLISIL